MDYVGITYGSLSCARQVCCDAFFRKTMGGDINDIRYGLVISKA